jgi:hypothetical protein
MKRIQVPQGTTQKYDYERVVLAGFCNDVPVRDASSVIAKALAIPLPWMGVRRMEWFFSHSSDVIPQWEPLSLKGELAIPHSKKGFPCVGESPLYGVGGSPLIEVAPLLFCNSYKGTKKILSIRIYT